MTGIRGLNGRDLQKSLVISAACAFLFLAGQTAVAGFVATASAYDFECEQGELFFAHTGNPAVVEDSKGIVAFRVKAAPGEVKVLLEGFAKSQGAAVSGTGDASGSANDRLHVLFFASKCIAGIS